MSHPLRSAYPSVLITRAENGFLLTIHPPQFSRTDIPSLGEAIARSASSPKAAIAGLVQALGDMAAERFPTVEVYHDFDALRDALISHLTLPEEYAALAERPSEDIANICSQCTYLEDDGDMAIMSCPECGGPVVSNRVLPCPVCGGRVHLSRRSNRPPGHPHEIVELSCEDCDYEDEALPFTSPGPSIQCPQCGSFHARKGEDGMMECLACGTGYAADAIQEAIPEGAERATDDVACVRCGGDYVLPDSPLVCAQCGGEMRSLSGDPPPDARQPEPKPGAHIAHIPSKDDEGYSVWVTGDKVRPGTGTAKVLVASGLDTLDAAIQRATEYPDAVIRDPDGKKVEDWAGSTPKE